MRPPAACAHKTDRRRWAGDQRCHKAQSRLSARHQQEGTSEGSAAFPIANERAAVRRRWLAGARGGRPPPGASLLRSSSSLQGQRGGRQGAAGRRHGRSVQPGFWNNYVQKSVFSGGTAAICLAAAWPAHPVPQKPEVSMLLRHRVSRLGSGWINCGSAPRPRFTLSATLLWSEIEQQKFSHQTSF
eukprot:SAG25_NODE_142_length_14075_cov_38.666070_2_plen_186_part_00